MSLESAGSTNSLPVRTENSLPVRTENVSYSLNPTLFNKCFPFHIVLDRHLSILQLGTSIQKVLNETTIGNRITDHLRISLPHGAALNFDSILNNINNSFLLEHLNSSLKLRGGFIFNPESVELYYLCSPWVMSPQELDTIGFTMSDFAPHDTQYDLLVLGQIQQQNFDDMSEMAGRLKKHTEELEHLNKELDNRILEKTKSLSKALLNTEASENKLMSILDSLDNVAIFMTNLSGRIVSWNTGCKNLFGYDESIVGKHFDTIFCEMQNFANLKRTEKTEILIDADGNEKFIRLTSRDIKDENNPGFVFMLEDITEAKGLESMKRDIQKFELLGQLTGGLAHDFNNLLGIIVANLDTLKDFLKPEEIANKCFDSAIDASMRASDITHSLLTIARKNNLKLSEYDINDCISRTTGLLKTTIGKEISFLTDFYPGSLIGKIDYSFFSNSLLNLVINSRGALQNCKDPKIILATDILYASKINDIFLQEGWYATITISDNGHGISEDILPKVAEPFFTTKDNKGTGLGLSMVHSFVKQINGELIIRSTVNKGTSVKLFIPLLPEQAKEQQIEENNRLEALHNLGILDTPQDSRYEKIVQELVELTGANYGFISFVDRDRQWFKAIIGSDLSETPLKDSICAHAIKVKSDFFTSNDVGDDIRFCGKSSVESLDIGFYCGAPLIDKNGVRLGMLAIAHDTNLHLNDKQIMRIKHLANKVMALVYDDFKKHNMLSRDH